MKISASKKQLAKIISESGGWRDATQFSAQDRNGSVTFFVDKPWLCGDVWEADEFECVIGFSHCTKLPNWHQTILPRDEYFHLYPASDADGWIEWKGGERPVDGQVMIDVKFRYGACATSGADCFNFTHDDHKASDIIAYRLHKPERQQSTAVGDDETNLAAKEELEALEFEPAPTIEQLAADYRHKLAIAQQAQEEADSHRCGAEAALEMLYQAGLAIGLDIAIADSSPEDERQPELVITDWRDLRVLDIVWIGDGNSRLPSGEYEIKNLNDDELQPFMVMWNGQPWWPDTQRRDWRFVRRP